VVLGGGTRNTPMGGEYGKGRSKEPIRKQLLREAGYTERTEIDEGSKV